ncbi:hypothetical protein H7347_01015 [Corynebacterium sp. zg-331]|uniref:hypothetical protein n=1 Tax=unclassified Corynebacterium TaxID=2624378 RepID=UPI00128D36F1|nr:MULTISPECIES: hypothetical protein [unclassified Corynebacterium]MBC3185166.1 hypothetical protein [Corynebacterium sp. zg-331]MPV51664.1 hypothetical protein [Corynebacterium sp. zg331]
MTPRHRLTKNRSAVADTAQHDDTFFVGSPTSTEVVFIGPVGVGKTTAVRTLSSIPTINTEAQLSSQEDLSPAHTPTKQSTTVGLDIGMWKRPDGTLVGLYGTPGQDRFVACRTPMLNPQAGIVIWLYGNSPVLIKDLYHWIDVAGGKDSAHRLTVALNYAHAGNLSEVEASLRKNDHRDIPVQVVDPRREEEVRQLVNTAITRQGFPA